MIQMNKGSPPFPFYPKLAPSAASHFARAACHSGEQSLVHVATLKRQPTVDLQRQLKNKKATRKK